MSRQARTLSKQGQRSFYAFLNYGVNAVCSNHQRTLQAIEPFFSLLFSRKPLALHP